MRQHITRARRAVAGSLRAAAARLDPPTQPYGEWDTERGVLVIKVPGTGMKLAEVNIGAGQIATKRGPMSLGPQ